MHRLGFHIVRENAWVCIASGRVFSGDVGFLFLRLDFLAAFEWDLSPNHDDTAHGVPVSPVREIGILGKKVATELLSAPTGCTQKPTGVHGGTKFGVRENQ